MLALTRGRLLRGGTPDIMAAARQVITDWNQQKIPYMSEPPVIHPSQMPSSTPGAEAVGQAQIVTEMSKPFELDGLFSAADSGAFAPKSAQHQGDGMQMDQDGEEVLHDTMDETFEEAETSVHSLKRPRSPTPEAQSSMDDEEMQASLQQHQRMPKRLRKNRDIDPLDVQTVQHMSKNNPLNRRALKKERKKERKRMRASGEGGGMDVDAGEDLQFTFMA
jgi:nuclear GTP-binding protein